MSDTAGPDEAGRSAAYQGVTDRLEQALRSTGQWTDEPVPAFDPAEASPFGGEVLPFTRWLQWVLLPRLRLIAEGGADPPGSSDVAAYAVRELDGQHELAPVVDALHDLDALVNGPPGYGPH